MWLWSTLVLLLISLPFNSYLLLSSQSFGMCPVLPPSPSSAATTS